MDKQQKRHQSLILLSREHQLALLLCLRLHRGLPEHDRDLDWLILKSRQVVEFFGQDLTLHFRAEEQFLFPAMRSMSGTEEILADVMSDHRKLEELVSALVSLNQETVNANEVLGVLARTILEFADELEAHIRKEERVLFPIYEKQVSGETAARIESDILSMIGDASQPRIADW